MIDSLASIAEGKERISEIYPEVGDIESENPKSITLEKITQNTLEWYEGHESKSWIISSGCGAFLADQIIALNLEELKNPSDDEDEPLADKVKKVEIAIRNAHKETGYKWEDIKNGFYAEAAMAIALKQIGFQVYIPDPIDDQKGKIDLYITDDQEKENPFIGALQLKNSVNMRGVLIENAHNINSVASKIKDNWDFRENNYEIATERLNHLVNSLDKSVEQMLDYLPLNHGSRVKIIPIVAIISGGEGSSHSMYNVRTGSPRGEPFEKGGMASKVYDEIYKIIYS